MKKLKENKTIKRGDILQISVPKGLGNELGGISNCVVLSNNKGNQYSNIITVAFITNYREDKVLLPTHVKIELNDLDKIISLEHIRTISKERVTQKVGEVQGRDLVYLDKRLKISLGLI